MLIRKIKGVSLAEWEEWIKKEIDFPKENLRRHPDVVYVLEAFYHLIQQVKIQNTEIVKNDKRIDTPFSEILKKRQFKKI